VSGWTGPRTTSTARRLAAPGPVAALKRLHAIQWTPGAGNPRGWRGWTSTSASRPRQGVIISLSPDEVETAVRELRPEGLFIFTWAASRGAAEALLERVTQSTRDRPRRNR